MVLEYSPHGRKSTPNDVQYQHALGFSRDRTRWPEEAQGRKDADGDKPQLPPPVFRRQLSQNAVPSSSPRTKCLIDVQSLASWDGSEAKIASSILRAECPLMGWSGRAPVPTSNRMLGRGAKDKEHAMSQTFNAAVSVVGIDIGKNSFHIVGHDKRGAIVLRQKWLRGQVEARFANMPPCLVGMEACVGAHHLSRKLRALGHDARLMPAKYVRPYSKGQKNDFRDAEAIAEAVQRPTMKFVATKTADQLDLQALHRVRERLVSQRTGVINQIRAFLLERGIAVRQGLRFLRSELPRLLTTPPGRSVTPHGPDHRRPGRRLASARRAGRAAIGRDRSDRAPGCQLRAADERARCWADHLQRDGSRDRHWGCVHEGPRLRRLAGARAKADLDRGPYHPRQDIQARQSLPAGSVRAGGMGGADQTENLGAPRAKALDRGGQQAAASQCAGDRTRQQARPHRLERSGARSLIRSRITENIARTSDNVITNPFPPRSARGKEEMEDRSSRRMRTLVTQMAR